MRRISLDTETTGLDHNIGHKIIEIGCVELNDNIPTGNIWHYYINPMREISQEATDIHGLTLEFLKTKPLFLDLADKFLDFINNAELIIHNAQFDLGFINSELKNIGYPSLENTKHTDTVKLAKQKFPGSPVNLNALCKRFNIDISKRTKHGALLDAELLAEVYLELTGGRQKELGLNNQVENKQAVISKKKMNIDIKPIRKYDITFKEKLEHQKMLSNIKKPIWKI